MYTIEFIAFIVAKQCRQAAQNFKVQLRDRASDCQEGTLILRWGIYKSMPQHIGAAPVPQ